jgi:PAS domain S-box-containing protein
MNRFSLTSLKRHWQQGINSSIARRFVWSTVLCSSILALFITVIQLYIDYRSSLSTLKQNITYIEKSRVPSIIESLWSIDESLINAQLQGMLQIDGIDYVAIVNREVLYAFGDDSASQNTILHRYPLGRMEGERHFVLGELKVKISLDHIYDELAQRALIVLLSNSVKTLLVAMFIILIYQVTIGQHLSHIVSYARQYNEKGADLPLKLHRENQRNDELDDLEKSINHWIHRNQAYLSELQKVKEQYDVAVQGSSVGLWDWDIVNDDLYWSRRFKEIIGIDELGYQASFTSFEERLHPEDKESILKAVETHLVEKVPYDVEYRLRHTDGYYIWIHARGQALWDHNGNPTRMAGSIDDISESKKNALELEKALAFQKLLMNVNTDLVFVKDEDFRIVEANTAFLELYPEEIRDSIIGRTTVEEYEDEQANEFLEEDRKAFAEGLSEVVETIDFPDGKTRTLLTKKLRFEGSENNRFILGIARDVTQLKQAEEALVKANAELEEFSYRTSHDLRSPLISSTKLLSIIRDTMQKGDIEKAVTYIDVVQCSLEKLENLVSDILRLAKLNHSEVDAALVNIPELVDNSLQKFSHMDNYECIHFSHKYLYDEPITASVEDITLIIENLLSNAIKYQDTKQENSYIHISTEKVGRKFILTVTDNGLGIPDHYKDKLFSMFKRFHPNTAFGSGLGLYMMKKSVEKMGGTIAYNDTGEGTQFIVTLPIEPSIK